MKKALILLATFTFISGLQLKAQIDWGNVSYTVSSCNFENPCPEFKLYSSDPANLWQIGVPGKLVFNAAHSPVHALVTDTANTYPSGNHSFFDLIINLDSFPMGPNPVISFYHKWNMDSASEGAWIEISYDSVNWKYILIDSSSYSVNWPYINAENLYGPHDTLLNGTPAFTGSSNGWVLTRFQWIWWLPVKNKLDPPFSDTLFLRFHFLSDSIETGRDGWMIDDLEISNVEFWGALEEYPDLMKIKTFPNPAKDFLLIDNILTIPLTVDIYSIDGRKLLHFNEMDERQPCISVKTLSPGIYGLMISSREGKQHWQYFVKE